MDAKGEEVFDIRKNKREVIRAQRTSFEGYDLVDIRVWVPDRYGGSPDALVATPKGIAFRAELLGEVLAALEKLAEAADTGSVKGPQVSRSGPPADAELDGSRGHSTPGDTQARAGG